MLICYVAACTCNPATLKTECQICVSFVSVGGNSPSIGRWIVGPPVIQNKERNLTENWDLMRPNNKPRFQVGLNLLLKDKLPVK